MRKPKLVHIDANKFMRMVWVKSATFSFFHTLAAHQKKYTRIGSMQVAKTPNFMNCPLLINSQANKPIATE